MKRMISFGLTMKNTFKVLIAIALMFVVQTSLNAQIKGEKPEKYNPDTVFTFQPAQPLIVDDLIEKNYPQAWGIDLLFSESGFGMGVFYQRNVANDLYGFLSLYISGARNTDEFEQGFLNPETGYYEYRVPNKVNRLYIFPLMVGLQKYLFGDALSETFKPYISGGAGITMIMATPYDREFFSAFSYAKVFGRFGGFLGLGANFNISSKNYFGIECTLLLHSIRWRRT